MLLKSLELISIKSEWCVFILCVMKFEFYKKLREKLSWDMSTICPQTKFGQNPFTRLGCKVERIHSIDIQTSFPKPIICAPRMFINFIRFVLLYRPLAILKHSKLSLNNNI